ncbi:MAG TPA: DUF177 domain-containing protein [Xanthobacteraceae bacterium]|nr:DUF177 domain-containing protein [Xanthobacteraceae bacterium]
MTGLMAAMTRRTHMSETAVRRPWSVRLDQSDVPETGRHVDLVADGETRAAIAELAGVAALSRLVADFDVTRYGRGGLRVVGRMSATVEQTCVVTLEPIESTIDEPIDLAFVPGATPPTAGVGEVEMAPDAPDELVDGAVDLGAIATEFLILGIDPYPRKAGAVFEAPAAGDDSTHPFAALSALKKGQDKGRGGKQG